MLQTIRTDIRAAAGELLAAAKTRPGDLFVVGCSTSEVAGAKIGTLPGPEIAAALVDELLAALRPRGLLLAAQCCEHLNRALVVEAAAAEAHGLAVVNALPQPKAGGSFATAAFAAFESPVLVAGVRATAGLDIGHTLIGMHLVPVAVPVRLATRAIGAAPLVAARTRPPFVGGERAVYNPTLL